MTLFGGGNASCSSSWAGFIKSGGGGAEAALWDLEASVFELDYMTSFAGIVGVIQALEQLHLGG